MAQRKKTTRTSRTERLRWRIVRLLDRLQGQCWADLVGWALEGPKRDNIMPWQPQGYSCRRDFDNTGACYCGKLRQEETNHG